MKRCLIGFIILMGLFGCSSKKYVINFHGSEGLFKGAKSSYREGEKVVLSFPYIATDTGYSFELDGNRINCGYDERNGYIISFVMPSHNVDLKVYSKNSMEYQP